MVVYLNEMTPKVDSDQTLPQERAKYDPIVIAEVVVGVWIALCVLVHSLPRGLPAPVPRGLATSQLCVWWVLSRTNITFSDLHNKRFPLCVRSICRWRAAPPKDLVRGGHLR